jgi:hypothetical protein
VDIIVDLRSATLADCEDTVNSWGSFAPCRMLVRFEAAESNGDAHTISVPPRTYGNSRYFASVEPRSTANAKGQRVKCNSRSAPDSLAEAEILFVFNSLNRNHLATCFNRLRCGSVVHSCPVVRLDQRSCGGLDVLMFTIVLQHGNSLERLRGGI